MVGNLRIIAHIKLGVSGLESDLQSATNDSANVILSLSKYD